MQESLHSSESKPQPLPVNPIPFDYQKHHTRYRRQVQSSYCDRPDSVRHVLFMLDTSGSIGPHNFNLMIESVSKLVRHFCERIKIAVMVFNHYHFVEFCFDCFDNNCDGRRSARDKIRSIPYRSGNTHTASATQCACSDVLTPSCGFDTTSTRGCLDMVYITDGQSNDPNLEVCSTVECLYRTPNTDLNVFVIGIGNYVNEQELQCISRNRNPNFPANAIFKVDDFTSFSDAIGRLETLFSDPAYQATLFALNQSGPDCFTTDPNAPEGVGNDDCNSS